MDLPEGFAKNVINIENLRASLKEDEPLYFIFETSAVIAETDEHGKLTVTYGGMVVHFENDRFNLRRSHGAKPTRVGRVDLYSLSVIAMIKAPIIGDHQLLRIQYSWRDGLTGDIHKDAFDNYLVVPKPTKGI